MFEFQQDEVYCRLVHLILNSEGGYVNDPDDPGGATKYGITMRDNRAVLLTLGVKDVRNLTYDQAKQIYYNKYYRASGADVVAAKSVKLAYAHFDSAVNHGVGTAARFLRQCSGFDKFKNFEGAGKNIDFWDDQFHDYLAARLLFYVQIRKGGGFQKYGGGWVNRVARMLQSVRDFAS